MNAYLVLDFSVNDPENFREYMMNIPAFIEKYEGFYIVKGGNPTNVEGDWNPERFVIIEFPSRDKANEFLEDPECRKLLEVRINSTTSKMILVDGVSPEACT